MGSLSQRLRGYLPRYLKRELRRYRYQYLIRRGRFVSGEREFALLDRLLRPGDVVIDVGANVGHYTLRMARLVGGGGHVLAFEPIWETFDLLSSNVTHAKCSHVSLFNAAVTERPTMVGFEVPSGNPYLARAVSSGGLPVVGLSLDAVVPDSVSVSFVKIDAEGHDVSVVRSAAELIKRDRPIVMIELALTDAQHVASELAHYEAIAVDGSHNSFLCPTEKSTELRERLQ